MRFSEEWMMYVICKAIWKYEPGYRKKMGGVDTEFDVEEEKECLLNLILSHRQINGKKKSKIKAINYLMRAVEKKMLIEFIFFEIWLPQETAHCFHTTEKQRFLPSRTICLQ